MINFTRNVLGLYKIRPRSFYATSVLFSTSKRALASPQSDEINDKPVHYFGSKAASWRASESRSAEPDEWLWYQPYVISASVAVFLIYFCYLREENDIDKKLESNLFDQVQGLEEVTLTMNYKYNKEHGMDVSDIEKRLKELGVDIGKL